MIYSASRQGLRLLILETRNIERIKKGEPLVTPDGNVIVAWTPDPTWLWEQIQASDYSVQRIGELVDEASKRPEKPRDNPGENQTFIIRRS